LRPTIPFSRSEKARLALSASPTYAGPQPGSRAIAGRGPDALNPEDEDGRALRLVDEPHPGVRTRHQLRGMELESDNALEPARTM
jgi:hypothetical protein